MIGVIEGNVDERRWLTHLCALDRLVTKSLHKDREERYHTVDPLCHDLKNLKQRLEFEAEFKPSRTTDRSSTAKAVATGNPPTVVDTAQTAAQSVQTGGASARPHKASTSTDIKGAGTRNKLRALVVMLPRYPLT